MKRIKSTAGQCKQLRQCHPGVGLMVYNVGDGSTCEFEFYIGKGIVRRIHDGKPISLTIWDEDKEQEEEIQWPDVQHLQNRITELEKQIQGYKELLNEE